MVDDAEKKAKEVAHLVEWPSYIGVPRPNVLLVGERKNPTNPAKSDAAFMPDHTGRAGTFLLEALPEHFWKGVGITNAYETNDFPRLVETLDTPPIVALGRSASDLLLDLDIEHGAVPHPSYVQRFHRKKKEEYGELIRAVASNGEVHLSWPK